MAKELGTPIVVVDVLDDGEPRRFPYRGNTRALRWRAPTRAPDDPEARKAWEVASRTEAERVVVAGVTEALRRTHVRRQLEAIKRPGDVVLDTAPEAVWLAWQAPDATFLYPDPPLGREEQAPLERMRPAARFDTPMRRFARRREGRPALLAVSISQSGEFSRLGLTETHERLIVDEVHLYLLLAGLRIAYGGSAMTIASSTCSAGSPSSIRSRARRSALSRQSLRQGTMASWNMARPCSATLGAAP